MAGREPAYYAAERYHGVQSSAIKPPGSMDLPEQRSLLLFLLLVFSSSALRPPRRHGDLQIRLETSQLLLLSSTRSCSLDSKDLRVNSSTNGKKRTWKLVNSLVRDVKPGRIRASLRDESYVVVRVSVEKHSHRSDDEEQDG